MAVKWQILYRMAACRCFSLEEWKRVYIFVPEIYHFLNCINNYHYIYYSFLIKIMKKYLSFAIFSVAFIGLGSLTSCQDEDLGVSTQTLKERAFDDAFAKQFGKPSPNQSWDFFTQTMQSLGKGKSAATRAGDPATGDGWSVEALSSQPSYITTELVNRWDDLLPEYQNNYTMGQTQYTLVSTGDGDFTISAIWYGGAFEIQTNNYDTHLYLCFKDKGGTTREVELFKGKSMSGFGNPQLADKVHLDAGTEFWFALEYHLTNNEEIHRFVSTEKIPYNYELIEDGNHPSGTSYTDPVTEETVSYPYAYSEFRYKERDYHHIYNGCSQLLFSEKSYSDNRIDNFMVIGIEDGWHYPVYLDFDYNDIVLYIDGDLPVPVAKRVLAEDLEQYDWDYNDVVFDIEYKRMVLRAVGGTKPVFLEFIDNDGNTTVTDELHDMMAKQYKYVNPNNNQIVIPYPDGKAPKIPGTDWYMPINVGAPEGIGVEMLPALIKQWENPLTDKEIMDMGTHHDIVLLVGEGEQQQEFPGIAKKDKDGQTVIVYSAGDKAPAMIMAPVETRWLKEEQRISWGYPWFYDGNPAASGTPSVADFWYSKGVEQYLY